MAASTDFLVLVASDGSLPSTAAVVTAAHWPWPAGTRMFGIVAEPLPVDGRAQLRAAAAQVAEDARAAAARTLKRRWPDVRVSRAPGDPAAVIIREARRTRADVIVMGWRGHGVMRRLLMGSVSRGVVRHANCSVLVVRRAARQLRQVVIGYDGSPNADRAVRYVARLVPRGTMVTLAMAVQFVRGPAQSLASAAAAGSIAEEVKRVNAKRQRDARRMLDRAATPLRESGCKVDYRVTDQAPLDALLAACAERKADVLAVGATGATGLRDLLVGSVAQGALDRSTIPVLVVR